MEYLVLAERQGPVLLLTLNRPDKRNALSAALRQAIIDALAKDRLDAETRVVVVTGAGKAFAAGADLDELAVRSVAEQRAFISPPHVYEAVARHPKPVIAAVNGLALGAGCELAMACDVRVASSAAKFGQPEINLGIIPGAGGTQRLARLVGRGRAARLVLTGDAIDAATAERWGLADEVVEPEALLARAMELANGMAAKSPVALRLAKEAVRAAEELPLEAGLAREIDLFTLAFASEDAREGIEAFRAKRTPAWKGR
ncbi:MAG TPA: enoyl-CoA hydratase-related protein [Candidatus Thermoplasmatota archaeon]|nr:enoyl-CoA hydratase-related protein [Candidatus Thermoplasmatota archaeon]